MLRILAVLCLMGLMLDGVSAIFYRRMLWAERPSREEVTSESSLTSADDPLLVIDDSILNLDDESGNSRADASPRRLARLASSVRPVPPESAVVVSDVSVANPRGVDEGLGGAEVIALGLRPDYAFKNVASMLKSFLDSRIKKQNKWLASSKAGE
jgi:hypothetical protein